MLVLDLGMIGYWKAYKLQEELVQRKIAGDPRDYLLLLEHPPVYTMGRGGDTANLPHHLLPIFRVNRGGGVTYHGPGQLVGYPIVDLRRHGRDVHLYIRKLEEILVRTLSDFGLPAFARPGLTGIWTRQGKIASIGIGVRKWITMHGFALNVACNLSYFSHIIPCGLKDVEMTTMERELGLKISMEEVKGTLARHLENTLIGSRSGPPAVRSTRGLREFSKITD